MGVVVASDILVGIGDGEVGSANSPAAMAGMTFQDLSEAQRLAGGTVYKKFFFWNSPPYGTPDRSTHVLYAPKVYIATPPTGMALRIGLGASAYYDTDPTQGNMTAWSGTAKVAVVSSDPTDERTFVATGLDGAGNPIEDAFGLTGTDEVVGTVDFSVVYRCYLSGPVDGWTVTVKQGSGGTTRGTIGGSKAFCFLWLNPTDVSSAIKIADLTADVAIGIWQKLSWSPGVAPHPYEGPVVRITGSDT